MKHVTNSLSKRIATALRKSEQNNINSDSVFIILPDGKKLGPTSRQEANTALVWMPAGARIDPPQIEGNPIALKFLDKLISDNKSRLSESQA
jgi:hypothetical protein